MQETTAPYLSTGPEPSSGIGNDITFDIDAWESLDGPPTTEDEGDTVVSEGETSEEDPRVDEEESLPNIMHNVPPVHYPVQEHDSEGALQHQDPDSAPDTWGRDPR